MMPIPTTDAYVRIVHDYDPGLAMIAFDELARQYRRALHVHCYRMLGSFSEAEDLVQDTLLRAWRGRDSFDENDGEAGMRRWLYRIATNACVDRLRGTARQATQRSESEVPWLQPYPDHLLDELRAHEVPPDAAAVNKETIALSYIALIQLLPAQQRAVLVLRDVLGWSAAETASLLELSVAAINSSLQRARTTLAQQSDTRAALDRSNAPTSDERAILAAFIAAHESADAAASLALMSQDIRVTMPPLPQSYRGIAALAPLLQRAAAMGEWRLIPSWANRQPAAVSYLRRPGESHFRAFKVDVLHVRAGLITEITTFEARLVETFGLPSLLP